MGRDPHTFPLSLSLSLSLAVGLSLRGMCVCVCVCAHGVGRWVGGSVGREEKVETGINMTVKQHRPGDTPVTHTG